MRGARGDGYEIAVLRRAGGAGGDGHCGGLRRARWARGDRDDYVFIDNGWACAGAGLADAIEIGVVILAWEVVAGAAVAYREVFPAENRGGSSIRILRQAGGNAAQRARRSFFVEHAVGVERHGAQRGVQSFVGLDVIDSGISRERAEHRLQTGARFHAAVAEHHVLAVWRDAVRQFRRRHIGDEPAENFDGRVE
jgi:hypothetical protein